MQMKVMVINGPNLGRLDLREKNFYGDINYADIENAIQSQSQSLGIDVDIRQSNDESEIISWLHEAADHKIPLIFNPAAFTHYSYAIRDAVVMLKAPSIEVHLSNPLSREEFRHTSVISGVVNGTIAGFGLDSYRLALTQIAKLVK
jgi:3-dehydroquinate dehydratase II